MADTPLELHLPQPILGGNVTLSEEQVVDGVGVDVGDPPWVTVDLDSALETGDGDGAVNSNRSTTPIMVLERV
ncbi:MAG: hypothetical protein ACE5JP_15555 [Candidatus Bipolaricaulia bacterium]